MAIKEIGDKKWCIITPLGKDPVTGKYRQQWTTFYGTHKEAKAEDARLKAEVTDGVYVEPTDLTVADYLRRWLDDYAKENTAPRTHESYKEIIEKHIIPARTPTPCKTITDALTKLLCLCT